MLEQGDPDERANWDLRERGASKVAAGRRSLALPRRTQMQRHGPRDERSTLNSGISFRNFDE
jgi:hypothetical protein